jgi:glycerol 2-dehydrogenase (NADP+)
LLKLSEEDMCTLDAVHAKPGKHRSLLDYHGEAGIWNWTYAEMGWEMSAGGVVST